MPGRLERIFAYSPGARQRRSTLPIAALYACLTLTPVLLGFLRSQPLQAANHPHSSASAKPVTCVFADRIYPEGAIIREGTGGEQMCVEAFRKPLWVRTSSAVRQQGKTVIALPQPVPVLCKPQRSHSKVTCACEGGAEFSPGSNVNSPGGPLSCSAGTWVRRTASVP